MNKGNDRSAKIVEHNMHGEQTSRDCHKTRNRPRNHRVMTVLATTDSTGQQQSNRYVIFGHHQKEHFDHKTPRQSGRLNL